MITLSTLGHYCKEIFPQDTGTNVFYMWQWRLGKLKCSLVDFREIEPATKHRADQERADRDRC